MNSGWLNLTTVQVARETAPTNDGMGAVSTVTTTLTTLARAAIHQASNSDRFLSDKVGKASTHVLVCGASAYTWTIQDKHITYASATYDITGVPDNVSNLARITVVGLERVS